MLLNGLVLQRLVCLAMATIAKAARRVSSSIMLKSANNGLVLRILKTANGPSFSSGTFAQFSLTLSSTSSESANARLDSQWYEKKIEFGSVKGNESRCQLSGDLLGLILILLLWFNGVFYHS
jgi:hypothetical protein